MPDPTLTRSRVVAPPSARASVAANLALLRWLWTAQWRTYPGRAATAVVAIAIGVTLGLGIHLVNRSALDEFRAAIAVVNGDAQLSLAAVATGFDESIWPAIATHPDVAAASPVVEVDVRVDAPVAADGAPASRLAIPLHVVGIDAMRAAAVTPSLLPAAAAAGSSSDLFADDAVFLSPAASVALGVAAGDTVAVRAGLRTVSLRVAGSVPGAAPGQRIAVMDLGAAQWRLGMLGRLTRIDLRLAEGRGPEALRAAFAGRLPVDAAWSTPDASRQRMSNLSRAYRVNLNVLALVALFTGGFIVYATIALGVLRQQQQLALLGVLGASHRLLVATVLGQGAMLGALGALLGLAGGVGLATAMLAVVGGDLGGGYFHGSAPALSRDPAALAAFAALGVAVGMAGSILPAWRLRTMAPARALRSAGTEGPPGRRRSAAFAAAAFVAGAALIALPPIGGLPIASYVAIAAWLIAGIAFVPVLTRSLGDAFVRTAAWLWRHPPAWFAVQRVRGAPASAAAALSGVVVSFALACAMAIMVHSFRESVDRWLDAVLPADLYGRAGSPTAQATLDPAVQQRLRALPGVVRAEFLRAIDLNLDPARPPVILLARPLDATPSRIALPITGTVLAPPEGAVAIYVSEAMIDLYGYAVGREVTLPIAAQGPARFFVAGVWRDYARQHGAIAIDARDYRALTGDASVTDVAMWLQPGADPAATLDALRARLPGLAAMEFRSAREIRAISLRIFDRSFAVTYVLEAVAIVVGLFGVAATFSGEALARAREFGMLRHLGVTRAQIAGMFALESAVLVVVGVAWGTVVGVLIAMVLIHRVNPQSFHWTMDVAWPAGLLAASAASLVALGVVTAVLAARSATGASPVRAVREDW